MPIPLLIDHRERAGPLPAELDRAGTFDARYGHLKAGDYLVDGRILFERKTLTDLVQSIKDGRLFDQALRLAASPLRAGLVIEGTAEELRASGMRWEAVQGALVTVSLYIGLPLLRTRSARETAATLEFAALQGRRIAEGALPRRGHRPKGKAALQSYVLQGLPGIGPERAARLLERFGSVGAVVAAGESELEEVQGIGRATARRLRWVVEERRVRYQTARRRDVGLKPDLRRSMERA